jgi:hypothetical protein
MSGSAGPAASGAVKRCPHCDATNPRDAAWCNLCARPFGDDRPAEDPPPTSVVPASAQHVDGPGTWSCAACGTQNPLDADACTVCGTSIFDSFGRTDAVERSRREAGRLAWVPGWGHAALGDQATAAMVVAVLAVGGFLGLLLVLAPDTRLAGSACLLAAVGTWGAAVADVRRRSAGMAGFLTGRRLLWVAVAVVAIAFAAFAGAIDGDSLPAPDGSGG